MFIDSHCHLDFPDFAGELDAVVARAQATGVARMVTISTRIKRHGSVLAVAARFSDVYCSVGTHPHYAHEELDIGVQELIAHTRHPKVVAITGSYGKTSTKGYVAHLVSGSLTVVATPSRSSVSAIRHQAALVPYSKWDSMQRSGTPTTSSVTS